MRDVTVRPIIFISAVSKELHSARQLVANTLQLLGYEPDWQDIFGTEEGDLRGMLRRKVDASKGVVQLVGQCYGAEPKTPDEEFGRVSYTQYEALYARQRGKKVWYLTPKPDFPTDPYDPEPQELRALQDTYREKLRASGQLYHPVGSSDALEASVLKLRDDLNKLRKRGKQWAAGVVALLVLLVGLVFWVVRKETQTQEKESQTQQTVAALQNEMKKMREGIAQYSSTETKVREAQPGQKPEEIEERTYADLAKTLGVDAKVLREKLPAFAEELKNSSQATAYERANAAYVTRDYVEAERLALSAADQARKANPPRKGDQIEALELAGGSAEKQIQYARAVEHYRDAAALTDRQRDSLEWARVEFEMAFVLEDEGHYSEEDKILREVVATRSEELGPTDPDTLRARINLALAFDQQGKYAEAEEQDRAVLKLMDKVSGQEHRDTLATRFNLAAVLGHEGKYAEAETEYRAVLKLQEKVLGHEDPGTLATRHNLAATLDEEGKHREAETEYRAVLKLQESALGPQHPDTLRTRANLAFALSKEGKYAEAEADYREVIKLETKVLGPEHPETLFSRHNLASVLADEGKYDEAETEYREVLKLREKVLGPEHPETLRTRDQLAFVLGESGRFAEAETEYRTALKLQEKALGPEHPDTRQTRANLAVALAKEGKYNEAEAEFRAVIKLREKVLGKEHPDTLDTREGLAATLSEEGKYDEAETEYHAVIELREKVFGPKHPETLRNRNGLAITLKRHGKYAEAEMEYRAVLALQQEVLGPENPDALTNRNDFAWLLATCPDPKYRNGREAAKLATEVCEKSEWKDAAYIDTLAAAEAESGDFDGAIKHEQMAIELARSAKKELKGYEGRLALYQQHKPYRTSPGS